MKLYSMDVLRARWKDILCRPKDLTRSARTAARDVLVKQPSNPLWQLIG